MFIGHLDSRGRFAGVSQCHQIQMPSGDHRLLQLATLVHLGKTILRGSVAKAVFAPVLRALIAAKILEAWPDCVAFWPSAIRQFTWNLFCL